MHLPSATLQSRDPGDKELLFLVISQLFAETLKQMLKKDKFREASTSSRSLSSPRHGGMKQPKVLETNKYKFLIRKPEKHSF